MNEKIDESWADFWKYRVLMQYECLVANCSTPQDRRRWDASLSPVYGRVQFGDGLNDRAAVSNEATHNPKKQDFETNSHTACCKPSEDLLHTNIVGLYRSEATLAHN